MVKAYTKMPVGAHYGSTGWLLQRLTAVIMAVYKLGLLVCLLWDAPATYADWKALFAGPFVRLATMLFVMALLYHAWIGMRDIFMDYVKPTGLRLALEISALILLAGYLGWTVQILWR